MDMIRTVWYTLLIGSLLVCGCAVAPSGETVLSPEAIETLETVADIVEPLGQTSVALSPFWPPAAIIGSLLAGAAGAWRRLKPQVEKAKGEAELATLAGEATSIAIEEFKKAHPDEWDALSGYLRDNHGLSVENFYRALRGLPLKD
jgi:hypothetical protein